MLVWVFSNAFEKNLTKQERERKKIMVIIGELQVTIESVVGSSRPVVFNQGFAEP